MLAIETIALAYLRPLRRPFLKGGLAPADIMRLPPTDFQGWRIEMKGETMLFSREGETFPLSLKKLIVQIDKERKPFSLPETPRELAKRLIHTSVERHHTPKSIADSGQGLGWYGYHVSIGGYVRKPGAKKPQWIDIWHIVVSEFEGEACAHIFDLKEVYHEIEMDLKHGYTLVQPTLF